MTDTAVLRKLDTIMRLVTEVRAEVATVEAERDPMADWRRIADFLANFVVSSDGRIHVSQVSRRAREAGYTPQGINGFYTGKRPSLVRDGDYRVITDVGRELYQRATTALRESDRRAE